MKRAYSILELLVVIAIIALLAAILFPVFAKAKQESLATKCISNLRQVGSAALQYQADNDGLLPVGTIKRWRNSMGNGTLSEEHSTRDVLEPLNQYGIKPVDHCPHVDSWRYVPRWVRNFRPPLSEARLLVPQPGTVLVECHRHLTKGWSGSGSSETYTIAPVTARDGKHLVLRADGSVGKADAHSVRQFTFRVRDGKDEWLLWERAGSSYGHLLDVFPGEPWPPAEWVRLPEMVELNWGAGAG